MRRGRKEEAAQRGIQGASGDGIAVGEKDPDGAVGGVWGSSDDDQQWKQELVKRASELFARGSKAAAVEDAQKVIDDLHRKIEQLQVERDFLANQVWAVDVTYIPMQHGFLYLVAIIDRFRCSIG